MSLLRSGTLGFTQAREQAFRKKVPLESHMSVETFEHSSWHRVMWKAPVPPFRLFGRFPIGSASEQLMRTEVMRFYPKSFGLRLENTSPEKVIEAGIQLGYQYCPELVVEEIIGKVRTGRKGYIVVPIDHKTHRCLLAWTGGKITDVGTLPTTRVGQGVRWSVVLAKPSVRI